MCINLALSEKETGRERERGGRPNELITGKIITLIHDKGEQWKGKLMIIN